MQCNEKMTKYLRYLKKNYLWKNLTSWIKKTMHKTFGKIFLKERINGSIDLSWFHSWLWDYLFQRKVVVRAVIILNRTCEEKVCIWVYEKTRYIRCLKKRYLRKNLTSWINWENKTYETNIRTNICKRSGEDRSGRNI